MLVGRSVSGSGAIVLVGGRRGMRLCGGRSLSTTCRNTCGRTTDESGLELAAKPIWDQSYHASRPAPFQQPRRVPLIHQPHGCRSRKCKVDRRVRGRLGHPLPLLGAEKSDHVGWCQNMHVGRRSRAGSARIRVHNLQPMRRMSRRQARRRGRPSALQTLQLPYSLQP